MIALIVGTMLAILALAYVLWPLFDDEAAPARAVARPAPAGRDESAIDALREIEFDRATGKLSDVDYASLKATYTQAALAELRERESAAAAAPSAVATAEGEDAAEAAVLRWRAQTRACPSCGPRPEPDALYCSDCGRYLDGRCAHCGATVEETGAAFCTECGGRLAA